MSAFYRHEFKYLIHAGQFAALRIQAAGLLRPDKHAGANGEYHIRSLYFDNADDVCYHDTIDGYDCREKYRIRIYNASSDVIHLERKAKENDMTHKDSCSLTKEECELLMQGSYPSLSDEMSPIKKELLTTMRLKRMRPAVIVSYDRIPKVYPTGNVRITFDYNISSSSAIGDFLQPHIPMRPILPKGQSILEVKWDEFLPRHLHDALNLDGLSRSGFSKYALCRYYNLNGWG